MDLLKISNLTLSVISERVRIPILKDVSLKINPGEFVAIVGETGSGKTLTAKAVMDILPKNSRVDSGQIYFEGVDLLKESSTFEARAARGKISMVFQNPMSSLNQLFRVKEQMNDIIKWAGHDKSNLPEQEKQNLILSTLELVKLRRNVLEMYPFQLSGGMRQRVMIAMSLLRDPRLLIADEPTTALDVTTQKEILNLLSELAKKKGMSLLLITHNLGIAFEMAKRTYVFYAGRVVEEGETSVLFNSSFHPYTRGLIDSIPSLDRSRAMTGIKGEISQADRNTDCCCFSRRCPLAIQICMTQEPKLEEHETEHRVACFVAGQKMVESA